MALALDVPVTDIVIERLEVSELLELTETEGEGLPVGVGVALGDRDLVKEGLKDSEMLWLEEML